MRGTFHSYPLVGNRVGLGRGECYFLPNRIWLSKSSGWNTKKLWRAFHNLMRLEGKKLASLCCQGKKWPNNGALSVRTMWVYTLKLAWNRLSFTKTEVQLQIDSFNDCIEGVFPTLILSKSKSVFSLEKDNIKSSGCKAIKGIPKSEETSHGETKRLTASPLTGSGRKRWLPSKRGGESQIKSAKVLKADMS